MIIEREETKRHISRKMASKMVQEMLNRIPEVDAKDSWSRLIALIVFGSYLDKTKDKLGDVDIIVINDWRPGEEEKFDAKMAGSSSRMSKSDLGRTITVKQMMIREMNIMASMLRGSRKFFQFHDPMTLPELIAHNKRENKPFQYEYLFIRSAEDQKKYEAALNSWVEEFTINPETLVL